MRISIISNTSHTCPPVGWGGEIFIWDLACGLDKLGHEITLYAPKGSKCPPHGKLVEIPLCDPDPQLELELYKKYKNELIKSDIVHDISHTKIFINSLYKDGYKNSVCTFFGFSWNQKARNVLVPSFSSQFAAANGLNGFEGTSLYKSIGYTGKLESTKVVHLCTNTDFYAPKYNKEDYFLYFGGLFGYKGLYIATELSISMGFKLIVASGNYPEFQISKFLEYIENYPNIKYIELTNDDHEIKKKLIQNAKAFLFPVLYREGFGLVTIESLSCGTPVITFNNGAMPEIVRHKETGFICRSIDEMKQSIKNINDIDKRKCRKDMIERFDRIVCAKNHLKIYNEVIGGIEW